MKSLDLLVGDEDDDLSSSFEDQSVKKRMDGDTDYRPKNLHDDMAFVEE